MAARKRAAPAAPEAKEEVVRQEAPEKSQGVIYQPAQAGAQTPAEHVQTALDELEAVGAARTYNQVNAMAYLRQAASWLQKDERSDGPKANR